MFVLGCIVHGKETTRAQQRNMSALQLTPTASRVCGRVRGDWNRGRGLDCKPRVTALSCKQYEYQEGSLWKTMTGLGLGLRKIKGTVSNLPSSGCPHPGFHSGLCHLRAAEPWGRCWSSPASLSSCVRGTAVPPSLGGCEMALYQM